MLCPENMSGLSESLPLLVKNKEKLLLGVFTIFGFLFGALAFLILVLPVTLFLSFFSGKELSYFMIANASLSVFLGLIFGMVQKKLSLKVGLIFQHIFVIGIMSVVAFLGLSISVKIASMFFLLMMETVSILNYLGFANTINGVLTLDLSKKYYGYISSAVSIGKISAIASLPFILHLIGEALTLTTVFFTQIAMATVNLVIIFFFYNKHKKDKSSFENPNKTSHKYWKDPLAICVLIGFFFSFMMSNIWGLGYYDLVGKVYKSPVEIARFVCFFNLVQVTLEFLLGFFFLNSFLKRIGSGHALTLNILVALVAAFLTLPLRPFLPLQLLTIGGLLPGALFYFAFSSVFFLNVSNLTLAPMQESMRNWTNTMGSMVFSPVGIAIGGYIFASYYEQYGFSPPIILRTLIFLGLIFYFMCLLWERYYLKKLELALSKQTVHEPYIVFGVWARGIARRKFRYGSMSERLFLANLVKNRDDKLLLELVKELITSDKKEENETAHYLIREKKLTSIATTINSLPVDQNVLMTLKEIDSENFRAKVSKILQDSHHPLFLYALKEVLQFSNSRNALSLWEILKKKDPLTALDVISSSMKVKNLPWILDCLNNGNREVQLKAFKNLPFESLENEWDAVHLFLSQEAFRSLFVSIIENCEKKAQAFLSHLDERPKLLENNAVQTTLISFLGVHQTDESFTSLLKLLSQEEDVNLQCLALTALSQFSLSGREFELSKEIHEKLTKTFVEQIKNLSRLAGNQLVSFEKNKLFFLLSTLWSLTYKSRKIPVKVRALFTGNQNQRAFSHEWLSYKLSEQDFTIIEQLMISEEKKALKNDFYAKDLFLCPLSSTVLKSYLIFLVGKGGLEGDLEWFSSSKKSNEPLVVETLNWALAKGK
jgi:hypothetical protein